MLRHLAVSTHLLMVLVMTVLAGCQDMTAPLNSPKPQFAQGVNGLWTVNTLQDPGDGTCDDTECTLREAIAAAASGDSIMFDATLQGDIQLTDGELRIDAKNLTINGGGQITVDAQGASPVFIIVDGPSGATSLIGLTIENGGGSVGGGIGVSDSRLVLDKVNLLNNTANTDGGGIDVDVSIVTIRNSAISGNVAGTDGGGISVSIEATVTLINSTVDLNQAERGGGLFNAGTLHVIGSTISGNQVSSTEFGGSDGGGIYNNQHGTATIERSTISGNAAPQLFGVGGITNAAGTVLLRSVTVVGNSGERTGGIQSSLGTMSVSNSIIAGNTGFFGDCAGSTSVISLGHNLTASPDGCTFAAAGDRTASPAAVFTQALESQLNDNGGPTKTHALIARGLAVDAGYCPGESEDQRGLTRPVDDPTMPNALDGCDIGAYEIQGPVPVVSDLMVSQSVDKTSVKQGELLTYFVRVQNLGPDAAPNVVLTNVLSSGVTFVSATFNKGTITAPPQGETGTLTWYIGDMADQGNEVIEIEVTVLVRGRTTITNTASVQGDVVDPDTANNSAAITVSVAAGSAGGGKGGGPKKN